jgi:hypothetical protein
VCCRRRGQFGRVTPKPDISGRTRRIATITSQNHSPDSITELITQARIVVGKAAIKCTRPESSKQARE